MRKFPKINLPPEGVPHARELEKAFTDLESRVDEQARTIARLLASISAGGRQTAVINTDVRDLKSQVGGFTGLPPDGVHDWVIKWQGDSLGKAEWKPNTVGGLPPEYVSITPADVGVELAGLAEAKSINVILNPTADGDPFELGFPLMYDGDTELDLPFFVLTLASPGFASEVTVSGAGPVPNYASNPDVPVNGSDTVWNLPADYYGAWFILPSYDSGRMVAVPIYDEYFTTQHGNPLNVGTEPTAATTADAGTGATVTTTGVSTSGEIELVTGASPPSSGWFELLTFTNGWTTGQAPVLHLTPANQAAAGVKFYATRSGVEAQAWFDMTTVAASTTYRFNYSLLPAA